MSIKFIVGIDEAGRGPLAGPVAVGAVIISKDILKTKLNEILKEIKGKDSKKLSHAARELWFEKIKLWKKEKNLDFHVALVSEKIIDKKGISYAIKKGIEECLKKLDAYSKADTYEIEIKLDGSLKAPSHFSNQKTIIKGDEKIPGDQPCFYLRKSDA